MRLGTLGFLWEGEENRLSTVQTSVIKAMTVEHGYKRRNTGIGGWLAYELAYDFLWLGNPPFGYFICEALSYVYI